MKNIFTIICLTLLATACSWHLRGSVDVSQQLSQVYLSAVDSKGALISELRLQLKANRVSLSDDSTTSNYALYITEENKDKRTAGVGGDALSSAYEITLKASYEITVKNNPHIIKATAISVRSFNYNTASINSAAQEEYMLDQEMRRDIAQQILRRLNATAAHPQEDKKHNGKTAP